MSLNDKELESIETPAHAGENLILPNLQRCGGLIEQAKQPCSALHDRQLGSHSLSSLRAAAKASVLSLARDYTATYRDLPDLPIVDWNAAPPIVMSGHQPDLFHCGVWYKNMLLSRLGQLHSAAPIHFVVDNDLCRNAGISVPSIDGGHYGQTKIDFDEAAPSMPWENRRLLDREKWLSFPDRVQQAIVPLREAPVLDQVWQHAASLDSRRWPLGLLLSQARHRLEGDLGLHTWEVPLSRLCQTREFAYFSLYLLWQIEQLQATYNAELDSYRKQHRIRNHAQPLPDLAKVDDWFETPWWSYSSDSTERTPLWASRANDRLLLSDRHGWDRSVELSAHGVSDNSVDQWLQLQSSGHCLRPRALMTTLYARVILSDLFIHGIGGARYDQITDRIIRKLFNIDPPPAAVATVTMQLDYAHPPDWLSQPIDQWHAIIEQQRHEVQSNPERLLDGQLAHLLTPADRSTLQTLASQKQLHLTNMPTKGEKWEWHVAMKRLKRELSDLAQPYLKQLGAQLNEQATRQQQQALLKSREYSFCLFSRQQLTTLIDSLVVD